MTHSTPTQRRTALLAAVKAAMASTDFIRAHRLMEDAWPQIVGEFRRLGEKTALGFYHNLTSGTAEVVRVSLPAFMKKAFMDSVQQALRAEGTPASLDCVAVLPFIGATNIMKIYWVAVAFDRGLQSYERDLFSIVYEAVDAEDEDAFERKMSDSLPDLPDLL